MFIGIDVGTGSVKVVLLDHNKRCVASANTPLNISRPQPGWSEQLAEDMWAATKLALRKLRALQSLNEVRAIGLTGQMHGLVLLDKAGKPLRPVILWNDGRSKAQCEKLLKRVPNAADITGTWVMPGFTAPKWLWMQEHEPWICENVAKILLPKDYVRFCLTGEFCTDLSDASGTTWLNVRRRTWSDTLLTACDLTRQHLPTLHEGNSVTGTLRQELAAEFGLPPGTPVVAGAGDNAASAIGAGAVANGQAFLSLGTSGVYFVAQDQCRVVPQDGIHTMCHALPDLWHHMTVHLSSASCLEWLATLLGEHDIAALLQRAEQRADLNPMDPLFLPYLAGERTPHNDPQARGVFLGLHPDTTRESLVMSVLEGVALSFAQDHTRYAREGIAVERIHLVGGGAKSLFWAKILASALDHPLLCNAERDCAAAHGAALLAWMTSLNAKASDLSTDKSADGIVVDPDPRLRSRYKQLQPIFNSLYPSLQNTFASLNAVNFNTSNLNAEKEIP